MSVSDPTRLFLVRHGQVDASWRGRVYGCLDVPLSPEGEQEARRAAHRLHAEELVAVVSSGLARAEFGAALLRTGREVPRRDDPELREIERGEWAGLSLEELAQREPEAWSAWHRAPSVTRPPGGESLTDLAERVRPRLDHWAGAHAGDRVAIVAHAWVIRVAVCLALGTPLDLAPRLDVRTGSLVVIDWPPPPTGASVGEERRPTVAGFGLDLPPASGTSWFRGPHRG